mmetsp:Transcript_10348/g.20048  ORF Transcript_10348/g.20048 Transcript_10348/m.20048 type:complete len:315 (+) Transcript_10348:286-1230(+)
MKERPSLFQKGLSPSPEYGRDAGIPQECIEGEQMNAWEELISLFLSVRFMYMDREGNESWFKQVKRVPMGSPAGCAVAVLVLAMKYELRLEQVSALLQWLRYIDDVFGEWEGSKQELKDFLTSFFVSKDPSTSLKFGDVVIRSAEEMIDTPVVCLDLEIWARPVANNPLMVELLVRPHTKKLSAHQYVAWSSGHSSHSKLATVRAELIRRLRLCTELNVFLRERLQVLNRFAARGYPMKPLLRVARSVTFLQRDKERKKVLNSIESLRKELLQILEENACPLAGSEHEAGKMERRVFVKAVRFHQLEPAVKLFR